jgi:hypothetical protein
VILVGPRPVPELGDNLVGEQPDRGCRQPVAVFRPLYLPSRAHAHGRLARQPTQHRIPSSNRRTTRCHRARPISLGSACVAHRMPPLAARELFAICRLHTVAHPSAPSAERTDIGLEPAALRTSNADERWRSISSPICSRHQSAETVRPRGARDCAWNTATDTGRGGERPLRARVESQLGTPRAAASPAPRRAATPSTARAAGHPDHRRGCERSWDLGVVVQGTGAPGLARRLRWAAAEARESRRARSLGSATRSSALPIKRRPTPALVAPARGCDGFESRLRGNLRGNIRAPHSAPLISVAGSTLPGRKLVCRQNAWNSGGGGIRTLERRIRR